MLFKKASAVTSKGISPMVATVLLIAFTVAVAGIVSIWITGFTTTSTEGVGEHSEIELYCAYGGISVSSLSYCNSNSYLSGIVENTNLVDIGNITIQITFQNATQTQKIYLCKNGSACMGLGASNMSLTPRELATFNVTIDGSNYDKIHVYTNCSNVYDDALSSDVTSSC